MKIKKLSEGVTYYEKTTYYVFEVNGKKVRVSDWTKQDNLTNNYDNDTVIDGADLKNLTELEDEAIGEYLTDALELKEGEEMTVEDYE